MLRKINVLLSTAVIVGLCFWGMPAARADVTDPDCGAMWLEGATARVRVDVRSGLFPRKDATVRAELSQDAAAIGGVGLPRAAVFRCFPGSDGTEPKMTVVSSIISLGDNGRPELAWTVGAGMGALAQQRYHIYLAPPTSPPLRTGEAFAGPPVRLPGENLVPNASFEELDEVEQNSPGGFYLSGSDSSGAYSVVGERSLVARRSGSAGFRAVVSGTGGGSVPSVRATQAEPVPVIPGVRYNIAVWANIRSASHVGLSAVAPFLDADGNDLTTRIVLESAPGQTTRGFELFQGWAVAPADAHFVRLTVGTWNSVGETWVDDVGLFADPTGVSPPPEVELSNVETQPQARKNLQLSPGGTALLVDLGPAGSMVAGGFMSLTPDVKFTANDTIGFEDNDRPAAFAGPRPDVLAQDHIELGGNTLSIRVPNGRVTVWMLIGDYLPPTAEGWNPSGLYRQTATVTAEGATMATVDRRLDFRTLHLETEDDAGAVLVRKSAAMWERYVSPRFADVFFDTEVKDGVLQLRCEPAGACPVAVIAVFPDGSPEEVQRVVADYGKRRRHSFTVTWAMPYEPPGNSEGLISTTVEQQRGFVAFVPPSDADIYPHTQPSRVDVNQAEAGLRIRVTPGETRGALLGIYPLVFRRGATLRLESPQTRIGETLGDAAVSVFGVRYRAQRLALSGGDPRFALRPMELLPTGDLDIRPGLTRSFWVSVRCPQNAQAGSYTGSVIVDAGRDRSLVVPLTIDVLPFILPEATILQGMGIVLPQPNVAQAEVLQSLRDAGMNVLDLGITPKVTSTQGVFTMDLVGWENLLTMVKTSGMPVAATVARNLSEATFRATGQLGLLWNEGGKTNNSGLSPETEGVLGDLSGRANTVVTGAGLPAPVFIFDPQWFPGAQNPTGLVGSLLGACQKSGARCTAPVSGWGMGTQPWAAQVSPRLITADGGVVQETNVKGGKGGKKASSPGEQWLYEIGGSRLGRGFLPWALGVSAVFEGLYTAGSDVGDPFDDWDNEVRPANYAVGGPQGIIPYLRWERTRMGILDLRYVRALELLVGEAKKRKKGAIAKNAETLLQQIRAEVLAAMPTMSRTWDYAVAAKTPGLTLKLDQFREQCVDAIVGLMEQLR